MTGFVLECQGYATGLPGATVGKFLESYDVDAHGGRGSASWTTDPAKALRFVSSAARRWTAGSSSHGVAPLRADGQPNRPLVAFTVGVRPAGGSA